MRAEVLIESKKPEVFLHDLSESRLVHYLSKGCIGIDTETRGLNIHRDRLCLVQLCDEDGVVSLVRFPEPASVPVHSDTNLKKLMEADRVVKIFHFARFDVSVLKHYLAADVQPLWCTKIASRLVRTYTDRHSLKDLVKELLGVEMDKSDQMSDWARNDLTDSQMEYAANDVRVLIPIYRRLRQLLEREGRLPLAERLFKALPVVCEVDLGGWKDIFEH